MQEKIPYLGFCMSEEHAMRLKQRVVEWVKQQMVCEGTRFFANEWKDSVAAQSGATEEKSPNKPLHTPPKPDPKLGSPKKKLKKASKDGKKESKKGKKNKKAQDHRVFGRKHLVHK